MPTRAHRPGVISATILSLVAGAARAQTPQADPFEPSFMNLLPAEEPASKPKAFVAPAIVERVPGEYPKEAAAAGREGVVTLEIGVDETGAVKDVAVKQGAGHGFDEAAVAAVKRFKFKPATSDGKPVPARLLYAYKFVIQKVVKKVAAEPEAATGELPVRIRGHLLVRGTRAPLVGASVFAVREGARALIGGTIPAAAETFEAESDKDGRFALRGLPPGDYKLVVGGAGVVRAQFDEKLGPDTVLTVRYFVDKTWSSRYETTVRASAVREEVSRQTLTTEELIKIPGTMGDPLRAIENLPGVARAPFNTGLIIIRGGKPTDSKALLSGTEVPQLYHFGGFTSIVPAQVFDKVDYYPGNFSVRHGRSIAGIVELDLRDGKRDRLHGYIDTNAFDTGASVEGPVGKGSFFIGARRSYIDAIMGAAAGYLAQYDIPISLMTTPVYYDYQAILSYPLAGGRFRAAFLGSDDEMRFVFNQPQGDPAIRGSFRNHIFFHGLHLRWLRTWGPVSLSLHSLTGVNGSEMEIGDSLDISSTSWTSDSRLEAKWKLSERLRLMAGVESQLSSSRLEAMVPLPPREGEQTLPLSVATKYGVVRDYTVVNLGAYAELAWRPTDALLVSPGLRFDYYHMSGRTTVNPRLSARLQVAKFSVLKGGVGMFSQEAQAPDVDKTFGNPYLRPENALHFAVGLEQGLAPGVLLEVNAFYKHLWDLGVSSGRYVFRDGETVPERISNDGVGRIYGGEIMLRQALSKWFFGWISYTLMRSERRDCPSCSYRLFDYDQTHVLIVALHANLPRGFEIGLRFRYISGFPYTLLTGGHYDSDADVYVAGRFPTNGERMAAFNQLDLRFDKTFIFERWIGKIYLDVTNVYYNPAQEQMRYGFDFKQRVPLTGLPLIPSFGVRAEF